MKKSTAKFPTCKDAENAIRNFEKIVWPKFKTIDDISKVIKEFDRIYFSDLQELTNVVKIKKTKDFKIPLFRVREFDSIQNKNRISEFSYPPEHITRIGRCNFPNKPVFYCSDNPMVALLETIRDGEFKSKRFCISKWAIHSTEQDFILENFLRTNLPNDNIYQILVDSEKKHLKEEFKNIWNNDIEEGFNKIQGFFHTAFINDANYGLSATLAHRTLFAPHNFSTDILIYPSVQSRYNGINMAINPNFVDQQMYAEHFYIVEIDSIDVETQEFNMRFVEYGSMENNSIVWRHLREDDTVYKKRMFSDFKNYLGDDFEFKFIEKKQNHNKS